MTTTVMPAEQTATEQTPAKVMPAAEITQQQVQALCAASIRALCGQADLHFRGGRLFRTLNNGLQRLPAFAPHLHPALGSDDFASFRGAADGLALRLRCSDPALHASLCPTGPGQTIARTLFELLEQVRVESLADAHMPGLRHNLAHRFDAWCLAFYHSGLTETQSGLILYTVLQMARARVHAVGVLALTDDLIETTRGPLSALIGVELLALRQHRHDQAAYGAAASRLADTVAQLLRNLAAQPGKGSGEGDGDGDGGHELNSDSDDNDIAQSNTLRRFSLLMDFDNGASDPQQPPVATPTRSLSLDAAPDGYRVYTRAYDREVAAASLVRAEQLRELRAELDQQLTQLNLNVPRLSRELQALFAEPTADGWDSAQETGRIDGARLAQLICTPNDRRVFRSERNEPIAHTALTFLLDCSGSMKTHSATVAALMDVMVRALDAAGVVSEVLGFSTGAWNGGRVLRDWQRAGRPPQPGRLNEALHLVFKDARTPWRRARPGIAALLKAELFREGLDGEAVAWAAQRLLNTEARRRVLVVLSDGCPMDRATQLANDLGYLDQHLLQVVQRLEQTRQVQVFGLGLGLDLSRFYSSSQVIDTSQGLQRETLRDCVALLAGSPVSIRPG
jgi:cobaltochelatase CobT